MRQSTGHGPPAAADLRDRPRHLAARSRRLPRRARKSGRRVAVARSARSASLRPVEDVVKLPRERLGLTGVSELAAEEAAVVAREYGRLLTEQLGGGHRRT